MSSREGAPRWFWRVLLGFLAAAFTAGGLMIAGFWEVALALNLVSVILLIVLADRAAERDVRDEVETSRWETRYLRRSSLLIVGTMVALSIVLMALVIWDAIRGN